MTRRARGATAGLVAGLLLAGLLVAGLLGAQAATAAGSANARSLVVYAKPTRAQFVNHADDRERGAIKNPFDPDATPTPPSANSGKKGARAGDTALFALTLFADRGLKRRIGDAIYSCTFTFAQQAICEVTFTLTGATMVAMGPADLDGTTFTLPVVGGTGRYAGAHGQMSSMPTGTANTQIVRFRLV